MALDWKSTSKWWYARYSHKGRKKIINLGIRIEGDRPKSINGRGSEAFRRCRDLALLKHDELLAEIREKRNLQKLTEKLIELKTGTPYKSVTLADMYFEWENIPRARPASKRHKAVVGIRLRRFVEFMEERYPDVTDLDTVTRNHARGFLDSEAARGVGPKTWNDALKTLRTVFRYLAPDSDAYRNYLIACPTKAAETIFREPFTPDDLRAILDAACGDDFMRPLIITAMCTAMRKGDCCRLRWKDVDLVQRFLTVKTAKTGQTVSIPIFPMLYEVLSNIEESYSEYVFLRAARMYEKNPDGITLRLKLILMKAGFVDGDMRRRAKEVSLLPLLPLDQLRRIVHEKINQAEFSSKKKDNMRREFLMYLEGKTIPEIAIETGCSRGSASGHLNELERMAGASIIRRGNAVQFPSVVRGELHVERENGCRRASIRDFHSFRVTWVTLALTKGVPIEIVQMVTGHRTTEIVMKHYFRPGREDFRQTLEKAMPELLMGGERSRDDQLRGIIERMDRNELRDRALALLG
jgi:integrase